MIMMPTKEALNIRAQQLGNRDFTKLNDLASTTKCSGITSTNQLFLKILFFTW